MPRTCGELQEEPAPGSLALRPGTTYTCRITIHPPLAKYYAYIASHIDGHETFPRIPWYVVHDTCYATCSKRGAAWISAALRARINALRRKLETEFRCPAVRITLDFAPAAEVVPG